jgi:DNA invertase Pin-like site-specific DNA recombinase
LFACWTVFRDAGVSGATAERPGYKRLKQAVARKEVDRVAAWSVDRLGRSLQELVALLGELRAKGVDLYLHQQRLDTSTPAGKAMFQMFGVFAEFERAMIVERVQAGLRRARPQGKRLGRPRVGEKSRRPSVASSPRGEASMPWRGRSGLGPGRCSGCERNRRGPRNSAPRPSGATPRVRAAPRAPHAS